MRLTYTGVLAFQGAGARVGGLLHSRQAQGIESILVASMCRYRTIILGDASRLRAEAGVYGRLLCSGRGALCRRSCAWAFARDSTTSSNVQKSFFGASISCF